MQKCEHAKMRMRMRKCENANSLITSTCENANMRKFENAKMRKCECDNATMRMRRMRMRITCHMPHITCHMPHITYHITHITQHISHITYHISRITCHISHITCHIQSVHYYACALVCVCVLPFECTTVFVHYPV
jgi:hypothetical protein